MRLFLHSAAHISHCRIQEVVVFESPPTKGVAMEVSGKQVTVYDICLHSARKSLENWKTLSDYNITDQSTLDVSLYEDLHTFKPIFVAFLTEGSRKLKIFITITATIRNVKERIQDKEGIPIQEQLLLFAGRELTDEHRVSEFSIQNDSTIHLLRKKTSLPVVIEETDESLEQKASTLSLFVRPHYGTESVRIEVKSNDSVKKVKAKAIKVISTDLLFAKQVLYLRSRI